MKNYSDLDKQIPHLRKEYCWGRLEEKALNPNPIQQFARWFEEAVRAQVHRPNAMTLATAARNAVPSARTVLLKGFDARGFVFFSNYKSQKGKELDQNPKAALVFYWPEMERQVCMTGKVTKVSREESLSYFNSRPTESRLAAWVSKQSTSIKSRKLLDQRFREFALKFKDRPIPMPENWGGFRLKPYAIEFWQGRENRLNDRLRYRRTASNRWKIERIQP